MLGAAIGVEAIFTLMALRDQIAPPTLNLDNVDDAANGLDLVRSIARPILIDFALSNGFGGVNATVVFWRWKDSR